jgi:hypothetical protein
MYGRADGLPSFQLTVAVRIGVLVMLVYKPMELWKHIAR